MKNLKLKYTLQQIKCICLAYRDLEIVQDDFIYWIPSPMNLESRNESMILIDEDLDLGYVFLKRKLEKA